MYDITSTVALNSQAHEVRSRHSDVWEMLTGGHES